MSLSKAAAASPRQQRCEIENIEIRLHDAVLYNSIYRADGHLLVNQHAYGVPAAHSPVVELRKAEVGDMADAYLASFERIWTLSRALGLGSRP